MEEIDQINSEDKKKETKIVVDKNFFKQRFGLFSYTPSNKLQELEEERVNKYIRVINGKKKVVTSPKNFLAGSNKKSWQGLFSRTYFNVSQIDHNISRFSQVDQRQQDMVKEKILNQTFASIYSQNNYTDNISYTLPDEKYKLKRKKKPFKPSGTFKNKYYEFKSSSSALNLSENNIDQKHTKKQTIQVKPNFYTSPTRKGYSNCPGLTFGRFPEYIPSQYKAISEQQIYRVQQKQYKQKKKPFKPCIKVPGNFNKFWKQFNPDKSFAVIQQQMKRSQSEHLPPFFPAKRPKSKFGRYPEWMPGKNVQEEKKEQLSQQIPQRVKKKKAWKYSGKGTYQLPFTVIANDIRNLRKENLAPRNHFSINVKQ